MSSEEKFEYEPPERDVIRILQRLVTSGGMELFQVVPTAVRNVFDNELWKGRTDAKGVPFPTFQAFVEAPQWHGIGVKLERLCGWCERDPQLVRKMQLSVPAIPAHGEIGNGRSRGSATTSTGRGTAYLAARLQRDRPDLIERIEANELTIREAAKEAGIVRAPDPTATIRRLWVKLTNEQRTLLLDELAPQRSLSWVEQIEPERDPMVDDGGPPDTRTPEERAAAKVEALIRLAQVRLRFHPMEVCRMAWGAAHQLQRVHAHITLGYGTFDEMLVEAIGASPEIVAWACRGLELIESVPRRLTPSEQREAAKEAGEEADADR